MKKNIKHSFFTFWDRHQWHVVVSIFFIMVSTLGGGTIQRIFPILKTSIIETLEPTEFTGTVHPIKKVPNWVVLSDAERKMRYEQLPTSKITNIPPYNPNDIRTGYNWNKSTPQQRNAYLTYSVPYMGNYKLDGTENSGSHLAVDIKSPEGTPVYAVANGVIHTAGISKYGSGKHVVIAHIKIPDVEQHSQKNSFLSTYAHLEKYIVSTGQRIQKGDLIGYVGKTGNATAPHLHFQIDRSEAPFSPYWPFTNKDLASAGLATFFDGVSYGIGKEKALQNTINPMEFVNSFKDFKPVSSTVLVAEGGINDSDIISKPNTADTTEDIKQEKAPLNKIKKEELLTLPPPSLKTSSESVEITFDIPNNSILIDQGLDVVVRISDASSIKDKVITLSSSLGDEVSITPNTLSQSDFNNENFSKIYVRTESQYDFRLNAKINNVVVRSDTIKTQVFKDVPRNTPYASAIKNLAQSNIIKGYSDNTFRPNSTINRAEAVTLLMEANKVSIEIHKHTFLDIPKGVWFEKNVATAANKKFVKGYADNTFRPSNTITRAEFLKIALKATGFKDFPQLEGEYTDVKKEDWFSPYMAFAKLNRIFPFNTGSETLVSPHAPITRAESAQTIYRLIKMRL